MTPGSSPAGRCKAGPVSIGRPACARPAGLPVALTASFRVARFAAPLAALLAGHAAAIEVEFGRCRHVAEAGARLACYDAIPHATPPPARPASAPPVATRAAEPASAPLAAHDRFGLAVRNPADDLQSIATSVPASFFGWSANERIRLDNGQVWEVVDGSSGSVGPANRKVTVRRGALGSYFLEFEGLNSSPRVRRLR